MFNIGMSEMLIILAVALLVFGPDKLPDVAKKIAKGLKEVRRASDDLRSTINTNFDLDDDRPRYARREPMPSPQIQGSALNPETPPAVVPVAATGTLAQGTAVDEPEDEPEETAAVTEPTSAGTDGAASPASSPGSATPETGQG